MSKDLVPLNKWLDGTKSRTPTLDRYAGIMGPLAYRPTRELGTTTVRNRPGDDLDEGATIPRRDLVRIRDELTRALAPVTPDQLHRLIQRLIDAYPPRSSGAEGFTFELIQGLAGFPAEIISKAISRAIRTIKFSPMVAELVALIEPEVRRLRWQRERVKLMLADHDELIRRHEEEQDRAREQDQYDRRQRLEEEQTGLNKARERLTIQQDRVARKRLPQELREQAQIDVASLEDEIAAREKLIERLKAGEPLRKVPEFYPLKLRLLMGEVPEGSLLEAAMARQ
jgi:hypothetical protein